MDALSPARACGPWAVHSAKWFSKRTKAKDINTCLSCHSGESLTFRFDGEQNNLDVYVAAGMVCAICHRHYDVHGDWRFRPSIRHSKAVRTNCRSCHVDSRNTPIQMI